MPPHGARSYVVPNGTFPKENRALFGKALSLDTAVYLKKVKIKIKIFCIKM
jgi:hypothetical protein